MAFHVVVLESRHDFCLAKMEDLLDVAIRTRPPNGRFFSRQTSQSGSRKGQFGLARSRSSNHKAVRLSQNPKKSQDVRGKTSLTAQDEPNGRM